MKQREGQLILNKAIIGSSSLTKPHNFYMHSITAANIAYRLSIESFKGKVDPDLMWNCGMLHDVGKAIATEKQQQEDPELLLDSLWGCEYLHQLNYHNIAEIIKPSFVTKELLEFMDTSHNPEEFVPTSLEQQIIVYSDIHSDGRGNMVSFDERMKDIRSRYDQDSSMIMALDRGHERLKGLEGAFRR